MEFIEKYNFDCSFEEMPERLKAVAQNIAGQDPEILKTCFSLMDLTTLHSQDTVASVRSLVSKVNALSDKYPGYPLPASICVYPNLAHVVKDERRTDELHVTAVAGCFPTSQSFLEAKVRECELAVEGGADEIDIVLALNLFLGGNERGAFEEICAIRKAIDSCAAKLGREVVLKVILETGILVTPENIAEASFLAMEAGADFIKTSTGKVDVNATPTAAYVMCSCIAAYYKATGRKVGFKAAGGISNAKDALCYYLIGQTVLGSGWLNKKLFRFGVSRLGNSLMSEYEQQTVNYF